MPIAKWRTAARTATAASADGQRNDSIDLDKYGGQIVSLTDTLGNPAFVDSAGRFSSGTPTELIDGQTGVAAAITATMAGAAAKTTYLSGFSITGAGATGASVIAVTITGLLNGTRTYYLVIPAGATTSITPLIIQFTRPLPASAVNTAIVVNVPSFGAGNTNAAVVAHGFNA